MRACVCVCVCVCVFVHEHARTSSRGKGQCLGVKEWSMCHSAQLKVCMMSAVDTKLDQIGMGTARSQPSVIVHEGRQLSDVYDRQKNNPSGGITDRLKKKKKALSKWMSQFE